MDSIIILDFGGQYCHLISRRIREQGVYTAIVPHTITTKELIALESNLRIRGIVLSGGPSSVFEGEAPRCDPKFFDFGVPVLGLCYGHQLIAHMLGGKVESSKKREYGLTHVVVDKPIGVLMGMEKIEQVWMSHGDTVYQLPSTFHILAHTENTPIAAFAHVKKKIFGLQWHPEVTHTEKGDLMLRNFLFQVCHCAPEWNMEDFVEQAVAEIKQQVGKDRCIVALSGGVDSSTAAMLTARAVGTKLTAVFVDHGLMRKGEPESVIKTFSKRNMKFIALDEKKKFIESLQNVSDPEQKRRIIGREFVRAFEIFAKRINADYLIQGTIYPDRIESGFKRSSSKIKTHHNVAGMPASVDFKGVIEPLKELYKDEVRKVANLLRLSKDIIQRQPFPGPGLAVRIIGEVTDEKIQIIKTADSIVTEEIEKELLDHELWQYFAVLMDTMTTGVKGDARAYGYTVGIRAVESKEAMTANFARLPYSLIERISTRITNEIPEVTRVVYDVSNKPPATIEWE
jgi:GMP synthase (glutamine-hydrolysing)